MTALHPSKLSRFGVDFPYFVAPMVGLSHVAFRELIREYTPESVRPLLFTEMLSTRRIPSEKLEVAESLFVSEREKGYVIPQLLGNEEKFIRSSVEKLLQLSPFGFDINMGCPSKKTLNHNWGVLLMGDKKYASEVVRMTKACSPVPVSVKLRAGNGEKIDLDFLYDFTDALETAGADWLTIHCRVAARRHRGHAHWEILEQLQKRRSIPIVANGDIQTAEELTALVVERGLDGAMTARAAAARPWILWQVAYGLDPENVARPPMTPEEEGAEYYRAVLRLCDLLLKYFGEDPQALYRLKFYIGVGHRWLPFGHDFWKKIYVATSLSDAKERIASYAEKYPQMMSRRVNL